MTLTATLRSELDEMGWGPADLDETDWDPAEFDAMGWDPAELDETNMLFAAPTAADLLHTQQVAEAMMPDIWADIERDLSEASRRTRRLLRPSLHRTVSGH